MKNLIFLPLCVVLIFSDSSLASGERTPLLGSVSSVPTYAWFLMSAIVGAVVSVPLIVFAQDHKNDEIKCPHDFKFACCYQNNTCTRLDGESTACSGLNETLRCVDEKNNTADSEMDSVMDNQGAQMFLFGLGAAGFTVVSLIATSRSYKRR